MNTEPVILRPSILDVMQLSPLGPGLGLGFSRFGASSFDPSKVTSATLAAWWRADKGIHTATGVSQWDDQSGSGDSNKNAVQAIGSAQPALNASDAAYNGQATLSFLRASSQRLNTGTWASSLATPHTIMVVGNDDGAASAEAFIGLNTELLLDNNGSHYAFSLTSGIVSSVAVSSSPRIFLATSDGTNSSLYISAKTANVSGATGAGTITALNIGTYSSTTFLLNGKIAEVAVFSGVVSTADKDALLNYGGARYGISVGA